MTTDNPSRAERRASPFNRTVQHDAKRLAILSQTARLFNYKGSRAATLRDIAESLGLTKTSLYYYVKTKEELIYQCYMSALDHHLANLDKIEADYTAHGDCLSQFFLLQFDDWIAAREGRGPYIAAMLEIASLKGEHRRAVESRYIEMFQRVRAHLREGAADGSMRRVETISATRALLGSVEWAFSWLHHIPLEEVRDTAGQALEIVTHGLSSLSGEYRAKAIPLEPSDDISLHGFDREQQNRLKQEAFLKSGTWFFNKKGFSGTSLDEIAENLNVSKGAFYYHIKNKDDLLYKCYSRTLDIVERIYRQASDLNSSGIEKIEHACRRIFHVQNSDQGPLIRYSSITALPLPRRREILRRTDACNECFGQFIREGMEDGSVRAVNPFVAQQLIAGAVNASMDIELWRPVVDVDKAAIDYFDIFFNGLLPRS